MCNDIISQIDRLIDESRKELVDLTIKLVNIKSVMSDPLPDAPFGEGPKKVLDTVVEMGNNDGFFTNDYKVGVVSVGYKEGQADLGIWVHGDVVPEGDGWEFSPYNAVEYNGMIIGRGSSDNKGQLAAVYTLMKIFKKLDIKLNYTPALYVGSNEEKDMLDLLGVEGNDDAKGFLNVCTPPRLSLVPDGAFPVGYGGKGNVTIKLKTLLPLKNITLTAGQDGSPGKAAAVFDGDIKIGELNECTVIEGKKTTVEAFSFPVHNANPVPGGNMITKLSKTIIENELCAKEDIPKFEFLAKMSADTDGKMFGIDVETKTMKPLTLSTYRIDNVDGCPEVCINIRYPIEITYEEIVEKVSELAKSYGFFLSFYNSVHKPYLLDKDAEMVKTLYEISNSVTGGSAKPYTLLGATYAHELPNAYVFGSSANIHPDGWDKGRGNAHGIDEAVSVDRLLTMMKIYARTLLKLNSMSYFL